MLITALGIGLLAGGAACWYAAMRRTRKVDASGPLERRLRESEELYREFFENARDIVCTMDMACNFTSVNRAAVELSGYSRDELLRMNLADILSAEDLALTHREVARRLEALAKGEPWTDLTFRMRVKLKGGRSMHSDVRPRIFIDRGRPAGFHVIVRDITEQKRWEDALEQKNRELSDALEAARQANEVKSRFLANMSHEIRTPMNGVIATSELLADMDLGAAQQEYVHMIHSSAEALLRVINDILDISKIEAGKLELIPAPFDIEALVADVESFLRVQVRNKALELRSEIDSGIPKYIRGDVFRLRQILLNLAGNAVKFTDKGGIAIRVALDSDSPSEVALRFTVADSGIGIAEQDAARLFVSFVQANDSSTRRHSGTGLGLAIAKQLVELMGGSIGLESCPGRGSTFWFTAPFGKADGTPGNHNPRPPASSLAAAFAGTAVLVAEDNEVNRTVATRMLQRLGCYVDAVADGREAVSAASRSRYDLIFMDSQMPGLDGTAAMKEIRRSGYAMRTPIVAVTASAMAGDRERFLAAGMDDFLTKPLTSDGLTAVLRRWANAGGSRP